LPAWGSESTSGDIVQKIETLAGELERTRFPSPAGFEETIAFTTLGLGSMRRRPWLPRAEGSRLLAVAPFANRTALDTLVAITPGERILVSRQETLDALPEGALTPWNRLLVLSDAAADEGGDAVADRPNGLHAKLIAIEHSWDVSWFVGSANLTSAAFLGRNVEVMAQVTGRKGHKGGRKGSGIERFLDAGFSSLCEPYHRAEENPQSQSLLEAQRRLEAARDALIEDGVLKLHCTPEGDDWALILTGEPLLPEWIEVTAWPISVSREHAKALAARLAWRLPIARLTAFVAFRLRVPEVKIDEMHFTLKLPAVGLPEGRMAQVLRSLIDSPERFLRFLRALLGGLDGLVDWSAGGGEQSDQFEWGLGLGGETLLEDLVRVASRDPKRLEPIKQLIDDLRGTDEGRQIVPDDLYTIWTVVESALNRHELDAAS
jgi:hypothetical protein